jgi:hypothetical protein
VDDGVLLKKWNFQNSKSSKKIDKWPKNFVSASFFAITFQFGNLKTSNNESLPS